MSDKEKEKDTPEKGKRRLFGCMPIICVVVVLVIAYQMGRSSGVRSVDDSPERPAPQHTVQNTNAPEMRPINQQFQRIPLEPDTRPLNQRFQRIPLEAELPSSPAAARLPVAIPQSQPAHQLPRVIETDAFGTPMPNSVTPMASLPPGEIRAAPTRSVYEQLSVVNTPGGFIHPSPPVDVRPASAPRTTFRESLPPTPTMAPPVPAAPPPSAPPLRPLSPIRITSAEDCDC